MKIKKNVLLCLSSIALFLLLLFVKTASLSSAGGSSDYLLSLYGGNKATKDSLMMIMIFQTPWVMFLYVFASYFRKDFELNYVYVFPRIGSKRLWLREKTVSLLLNMSVAWLFLFLVSFVIGKASRFAFSGSFILYLQLYLANLVGLFVLSFAQNLLSLWLGGTRSFLIELIFYMGSLALACVNYQNENVIRAFTLLTPISQQLLWHSDAAVSTQTRAVYYPAVPDFSFGLSLLICVVYFTVMYAFLYITIEKKDVMDFIKEE